MKSEFNGLPKQPNQSFRFCFGYSGLTDRHHFKITLVTGSARFNLTFIILIT